MPNVPLSADPYADALKAHSDRRAGVVAAGCAAASWVRARRATWGEAPPDISDVADERPAQDEPDDDEFRSVFDRSVTVTEDDPRPAFDHSAIIAKAAVHIETSPIPGIAIAASPVIELDSSAVIDRLPTERVPAERSHHAATAIAWVRSLGAPIARWLPRVGVVAVLLAIGVTGRSYWRKSAATPRTGTAVLESVPNGSHVLVDGKGIGITPLTAALSAGPHTVEFRLGKSTRIVHLAVNSGGTVVQRVDWAVKPTGRLHVSSEPAGARVLVDGTPRGATPLTLDDLPVGAHTVVLQSAAGSVRRSVTVSADETADIAETIFAGWLTVTSPFPLEISEGARALQLDDRSQIMMKPGPHELRLENRALDYHQTRRVDVRPGETTSLSIESPRAALTVTATEPAEIWVDGVHVDHTPLIGFAVELGTREVVVKSANGDERRFTLTVTAKPVVINADFTKPAP
jgi:hypothetical protein